VSGFNGPPRRFRIDATSAFKEKVASLFREARETGRGVAFSSAMQQIRSVLQSRPRDAGEPLRQYRQAKFELRVIAQSPVVVWFLVHQDAFEVVASEIVLMSEE
jgi:hypothetical protein